MTRNASNISVHHDDDGTLLDPSLARRVEQLWFSLSRTKWSSIALVPADEGASVAAIARSLAAVGNRLRVRPVTAVVAEGIDYRTARALAELQSNVDFGKDDAFVVGTAADSDAGSSEPDEPPLLPASGEPTPASAPSAEGDAHAIARALPPTAQIILAVRSVLAEPLGIAVARAADGAVVCVELGHTRLKSVRRTVELIGREHVLGCVLVPPGAWKYR